MQTILKQILEQLKAGNYSALSYDISLEEESAEYYLQDSDEYQSMKVKTYHQGGFNFALFSRRDWEYLEPIYGRIAEEQRLLLSVAGNMLISPVANGLSVVDFKKALASKNIDYKSLMKLFIDEGEEFPIISCEGTEYSVACGLHLVDPLDRSEIINKKSDDSSPILLRCSEGRALVDYQGDKSLLFELSVSRKDPHYSNKKDIRIMRRILQELMHSFAEAHCH